MKTEKTRLKIEITEISNLKYRVDVENNDNGHLLTIITAILQNDKKLEQLFFEAMDKMYDDYKFLDN